MAYPFETRKVTLTKAPEPSWGIGLLSCDGEHGPSPVAGYSIEVTSTGDGESRHDLKAGEIIIEANGTDLASIGLGDSGHAQYEWFIAPGGPASGGTMDLVVAERSALDAHVAALASAAAASDAAANNNAEGNTTEGNGASANDAGGDDEVTVGKLLGDGDELADKPVTEVLKQLRPDDPKAQQIKARIYDHTVPFTTRAPRPGEKHGLQYNFVSREEFEAMIKAGQMLEWGEKSGVLYGTEKPTAKVLETKKENKPFRATMKAALDHGHDAVTLSHVIGADAGDVGAMEVHEFMKTHTTDHPVHGDKVKKVKALLYDMSIPFTTRPRREGEKEGREYHFVSKDTFSNMADSGAFMEFGFKNGNAYGTLKLTHEALEAHKKSGKSRRSTMKEALAANGGGANKEASVAAILGATGQVKKTGSDIAASRFLASVDPEHPELADIRNQIKVAIYDITVPLTTRDPRPGERNGVDYNFVSKETFQLYVDNDQMLEWGEKNGVFYGTLKVTEKDVTNAKSRPPDARRKTFKEAISQSHPSASTRPAANEAEAYQTVHGAEWNETLV